jgi:uncharacterized membrane protein
MSGIHVYSHHNLRFLALLFIILFATAAYLFLAVLETAFSSVGFSPLTIILILVSTFVGSAINIPISRLEATIPIITNEYVSSFGIAYRIPQIVIGKAVTILAVNVGGAVIPSIVSLYLLLRSDTTTILYALVGVGIVSIVSHIFAKPVRGVGITMPPFVAPIAAALVSFLLPSSSPLTIAYVSGVFGTLIGADLTNLGVIPELGSPIASIGGAGTFDGIFLSGIIAVLLVGL